MQRLLAGNGHQLALDELHEGLRLAHQVALGLVELGQAGSHRTVLGIQFRQRAALVHQQCADALAQGLDLFAGHRLADADDDLLHLLIHGAEVAQLLVDVDLAVNHLADLVAPGARGALVAGIRGQRVQATPQHAADGRGRTDHGDAVAGGDEVVTNPVEAGADLLQLLGNGTVAMRHRRQLLLQGDDLAGQLAHHLRLEGGLALALAGIAQGFGGLAVAHLGELVDGLVDEGLALRQFAAFVFALGGSQRVELLVVGQAQPGQGETGLAHLVTQVAQGLRRVFGAHRGAPLAAAVRVRGGGDDAGGAGAASLAGQRIALRGEAGRRLDQVVEPGIQLDQPCAVLADPLALLGDERVQLRTRQVVEHDGRNTGEVGVVGELAADLLDGAIDAVNLFVETRDLPAHPVQLLLRLVDLRLQRILRGGFGGGAVAAAAAKTRQRELCLRRG